MREREREEICPDKVSVTSSGTLCGVLILCNGEPSSALVFENLFMAVNYPHTCQLPSEERLSHYWNFFFICILLCFRGLSSSSHQQFPCFEACNSIVFIIEFCHNLNAIVHFPSCLQQS